MVCMYVCMYVLVYKHKNRVEICFPSKIVCKVFFKQYFCCLFVVKVLFAKYFSCVFYSVQTKK